MQITNKLPPSPASHSSLPLFDFRQEPAGGCSRCRAGRRDTRRQSSVQPLLPDTCTEMLPNSTGLWEEMERNPLENGSAKPGRSRTHCCRLLPSCGLRAGGSGDIVGTQRAQHSAGWAAKCSCSCCFPTAILHHPSTSSCSQLPALLQHGWRRHGGRRGAKGEKLGGRVARHSPCPPSPAPLREQMLRGTEKQQQSCQFMCHFLLG